MNKPMKKTMIGLAIIGKDFGSVGMTEDEIDAALDARLELIEEHGLLGGGALLGSDAEPLEVEFIATRDDNKPVTIPGWLAFSAAYRAAFPTFDGHIYIADANHVTTEGGRMIDAFLSA
jgi:hypothetical protein